MLFLHIDCNHYPCACVFSNSFSKLCFKKKNKKICWLERKYDSGINLGYIQLIRKQRMMQDVEVTRMFHFSFPSSFNCSLAAQLEMILRAVVTVGMGVFYYLPLWHSSTSTITSPPSCILCFPPWACSFSWCAISSPRYGLEVTVYKVPVEMN